MSFTPMTMTLPPKPSTASWCDALSCCHSIRYHEGLHLVHGSTRAKIMPGLCLCIGASMNTAGACSIVYIFCLWSIVHTCIHCSCTLFISHCSCHCVK